jgi:hypothetical protein
MKCILRSEGLQLLAEIHSGDCGYHAVLTVKIRQPSHEFTFGVGISFIRYPLILTPVVYQVHLCMSVLEFSVYAEF